MTSQHARKTSVFLIRLILFWMFLFQFFRAIFLLNARNIANSTFEDWPLSFVYGLRLDFSTTCYLIALPLILLLFQPKFQGLIKPIKLLIYLEIILVVIIQLANIQLYKEWGTLLNRRAITFLEDPSAIADSLSTLQLIYNSAIVIILIASILLLFNKLVIKNWKGMPLSKGEYLQLIPFIIILPIGIRGGLQLIPVNESAATFSNCRVVNNATMNAPWYLANNILKSGLNKKNIYKVYTDEQANEIVRTLFSEGESTGILNTQKPNIVFIVLESWTADIILDLGGDSATTPFFHSLSKDGLLFTNIYASGRRTDQMFPSVLSGFPAQADHSIIRMPSKTEKLPMISRDLKSAGYSTNFYYGGEAGFANMQTYLMQGEFSALTTKDDFTEASDKNKWGAHDQYLFARHAREIPGFRQPFFSFVLTLSTHEPFDVPGNKLKENATEPEKFRNAAHYTDSCLAVYFNEIRKSAIYKNTLFVLVADHGHLLPYVRTYNNPKVYHIPLLLCGGALQDSLKGQINPTLGGQHDLPATILHQLGIKTKEYRWSNDLLMHPRFNFAYLNMDDAAGWLEDSTTMVWYRSDNGTDKEFTQPKAETNDKRLVRLHAYLQELYNDFLEN